MDKKESQTLCAARRRIYAKAARAAFGKGMQLIDNGYPPEKVDIYLWWTNRWMEKSGANEIKVHGP